MQKLREYWLARTIQQRAILIGAFAATFLSVIGFAWLAGQQPMALLYAGLDPSQAGSIVAEMDRQKIRYQIRGESIWVPASERDRLRLDLASQGMPEAGGAGYELLDGLSGFGTTSQMFDAAYWRAKEGELARTILASPNIKSARVHLAVPTSRAYRRESAGSASVTIATNGPEIAREQAQALRFLIASGVPGISPDSVTVIDSRHGIINTDSFTASDRQQQMKRDVERILSAHVGAGNAIVELNLEIETRSEQLSERRFDPAERALIAQEIEESTDQSNESQPSAVTAASNLPDGQGQGEGQNTANRETTRQRSNFEVSETRRDIVASPGDVRRLSVAVLVNGVETTGNDGTLTIQPRNEVELTALRELVASAVGLDEARGDQLTIKSLPFAALAETGTLAINPSLVERLALNDLIKLVLVGLFAIVFAFLAIRAMRTARSDVREAEEASKKSEALPPPAQLTTQPSSSQTIAPDPTLGPAEPEYSITVPDNTHPPAAEDEDPVLRLRRLMRERHDESIRVLSHWITDEKVRT